MELNVYQKNKIVKTYTANDFVLTTGLVEDILTLIDVDKLLAYGLANYGKGGPIDEQSLGFELMVIVQKSFSKFKPFIQDIFDGLTDEEYRQTSISEVAKVILHVINHAISGLYSIGGNKKN
jgi:hypothetical protein